MKYPKVFYELIFLTFLAFWYRLMPNHYSFSCHIGWLSAVLLFTYMVAFSIRVMKQISRELKINIIF